MELEGAFRLPGSEPAPEPEARGAEDNDDMVGFRFVFRAKAGGGTRPRWCGKECY